MIADPAPAVPTVKVPLVPPLPIVTVLVKLPPAALIVPPIVADDATKTPPDVTENCGVTHALPKAIPSVPMYIPAVVLSIAVLPL